MTFTLHDRNRESYFESIEVQDPSTVTGKKRTLKQFSEFCMSKFKESDESIISELLKQKPNEMTINSCDLLQQYVNFMSKKLSPSTIKDLKLRLERIIIQEFFIHKISVAPEFSS